ncbi:MAG: hypothetical protein J6T10_28140 [Methanobrevibacter sp.]|nr:hypothetical protein [Methanobrevibacter sp.]
MSKYTITIRNLIKNGFQFNLNSYPIFDEGYRETLNKKILDHYLMSEIGLETPELFNHYLGSKLNEIMPYYNTLYEKQKLLLNDLESNVNLTEKFNRSVDSTTTGNSSSSSNSKSLFEDTPQGQLVQSTMDQMTHASNINFGKSDDNSSTTTDGNSTEDYIKTITGNNGGRYNIDLLNDIKNNLLNIDLMIINDLSDLFMGIL